MYVYLISMYRMKKEFRARLALLNHEELKQLSLKIFKIEGTCSQDMTSRSLVFTAKQSQA